MDCERWSCLVLIDILQISTKSISLLNLEIVLGKDYLHLKIVLGRDYLHLKIVLSRDYLYQTLVLILRFICTSSSCRTKESIHWMIILTCNFVDRDWGQQWTANSIASSCIPTSRETKRSDTPLQSQLKHWNIFYSSVCLWRRVSIRANFLTGPSPSLNVSRYCFLPLEIDKAFRLIVLRSLSLLKERSHYHLYPFTSFLKIWVTVQWSSQFSQLLSFNLNF